MIPQKDVSRSSSRRDHQKLTDKQAPAKAPSIIDFVILNKLDILAIIESWLKTDHTKTKRLLSELEKALSDHQFPHIPRLTRGGFVGLMLRKGFNTLSIFKSFEHINLTVSWNS